ncbi:tyrosine-type recombinase/integrase [Methanococcoides burtonii]|uniref:tyrosine-type recombinase/integrase n=1 Tax=Methanococcoides burtonii TaxID=29291 RepID=UPI000039968A|nr:tyrosine-type recombinase/integrase [Methanococcoides burtonii]
MIVSATNLCDKAFIATLYETGARIGEMDSLQIKNIRFDDLGAVLMVNRKTGMRRV